MEFDVNTYLKCVLESHKQSKIGDLVEEYRTKRTEIETALKKHYGSDLYGMIYSGSYAKHTLINSKFDLDIIAPFRKSRFSTLKEMNDDVLAFFKGYRRTIDSSLQEPRDQRVSIGLKFLSNTEDFSLLSIDVVPGRELEEDDYKESKRLNLHARASSSPEDTTWVLTNIQSQIDNITNRTEEREVVKLLKIWKVNNGQSSDLKSFFIELIVIRAFNENEGRVPTDLWGRLLLTMNYIIDNICNESFQLKDPGNSNNIISATLTNFQKSNIKSQLETIVDRILQDKEEVKDYFPVNERYPCPEEKQEVKYVSNKTTNSQVIPSGGFA